MKNHKEMFEALWSGEHLVGIDERNHNEYWLDKKEGRIFYKNTKEDTFPCKCNEIPNFDKLQIKPKTININGFEVPTPVKEPLTVGEVYYFTDLADYVYAQKAQWDGDCIDDRRLQRGLIHLTKEAAIQHAEALLSFTMGESND